MLVKGRGRLENSQLKKRYGLFTAICMVVGIVVGSGVFFKAQDILNYTNGNVLLGILAWAIGGVVMVVCALNFANLAGKYVKVNGVVDYAESVVGEKYAYYTGWFLATMYYPAMTSVLAWVSARYTLVLFYPQADITGGLCLALGAFYLCLAYGVNVLSPKIAGRFQISSTVIKLIPLGIMIVVGTIAGIINGSTGEAFALSLKADGGDFLSVFSGIAAAAFAFEGWICATSINAELRDSKRNLPIALVVGTILIMVIYITYFIGLTGGASVDMLREQGATTAFIHLFGGVGGTVLNVFVVVSCLGTLNGLMLGNIRSFFAVAVRGRGPSPAVLSRVDHETGIPANSGALSILVCSAWYFYFYAANLTEPVFGLFSFDSSELPIITIYAFYIPIFAAFMKKEKQESTLKRFVLPAFGIIASAFMVFVAVYAHGISKYLEASKQGEFSFPALFFLVVFVAIMALGALFYRQKKT